MGSALAQAPDPAPPPKEPLLARAAPQSGWTIVYRYDREKALAELTSTGVIGPAPASKEKIPYPRPTQLEVGKDGTTYREKTTWSDGHAGEKWVQDGMQLWELPGRGKVAHVLMRYSSPEFSDYTRSDFEALEWIGRDNLTGSRMLGPQVVYVFSVPAAKKRPTPRDLYDRTLFGAGHDKNEGVLTAYLDAATQLPIAFDDGTVVYAYHFSPNAGPLTPPDKFRLEFEAWKLETQQNQHHSGAS